MGFFDKLFGGKSKDENTAKFTNQSKTVLTPLQGKVLAQADIPDETFAQGILGPGCGIEPTGDTVYAPFDGTVTQIATTLHAVGITSNDGIELLIHVGMDTVDMKGQGFTVLVKENQKVTAGTPLLKVDLDAIRAAGHPTATAIIVTDGAGDEVKMLMILNRRENVSFSRETVEKVEAAAKELGYQIPRRKMRRDRKSVV